MTKRAFIVTLAATVSLVGCGGKDLASSDPHGYAACSAISEASATTDAAAAAKLFLKAGEEGRKSSTLAIQQAIEAMPMGLTLAHPKELRAACEANGFAVHESVAKT